MKRRMVLLFSPAAALLLSLCLVGHGDARRKEAPPPRRVTLDGRSFVSDESPADEGSLLRRELGKRGVRLPDGFMPPEEPVSSHPAFSVRLKNSGERSAGTPRLPAGLTADHILRMEGEGKPVELVFGRLDAPGPSIRSRLLSSGWESVPAAEESRGLRVMRITNGKGTHLVCLDDAEGSFLLFREVGR